MYMSYVRPFKSNLHNTIIIFEDLCLLATFITMFKFMCKESVGSIDESRLFTKIVAFEIFVMLTLPILLAFIEFLLGLRNFNKVCNWTRIYTEEKEADYSSEES